MVYGFVKQSNGHIKVYSEPGAGTTIRIYLPRHRGADPVEEPAMPVGEMAGRGEHVLVVEDDELVRDYAVQQLRHLGYRVTSASSGDAAWPILESDSSIDLLLTDVVMPGELNGPRLAGLATAHRPELKVLYTSGYTENAIIHHGRLDPGVILLSKPYRRETLAARVRQALQAS
jgi:CheY-like chemotaxis protein